MLWPSCDDIGDELVLDLLDLVFDLQLHLLEAAQLQLITRARGLERGNGGIQVAMLLSQRHEPCLQKILFSPVNHPALLSPFAHRFPHSTYALAQGSTSPQVCVTLIWSNTEEALMSVQAHLGELAAKHKALEAELEDCLSHPASSDAEIAELKRKKLRIKDEMSKLEVQLQH